MTRMHRSIFGVGLVLLLASMTAMMPVGSDFYSIKLSPNGGNGSATTSIIFGFTAKKVSIQTPSGNSGDVCVSWSMNTMQRAYNNATCSIVGIGATTDNGMDRIPAGTLLLIDDMQIPGVTVIGDTPGQTVTIRAWR